MFIQSAMIAMADSILFTCCLLILIGSIFISFKMRFVQLRFFPVLFKMIRTSFERRGKKESHHTILPHRALFTAMSTTIGVGTIVAPVIAIHWGGPGALLGFLITSFLGSAATYTEVGLSIKYRKRLDTGEILGGPMQYLQAIFSSSVAKWYAFIGAILLTAWSAAQANQLAAILDSPLLGVYRTPTGLSGVFVSLFVIMVLAGGIKRVSSISSRLIPIMFVLYVGSCFWILFSNVNQFWNVCCLIFQSALSPYAMTSGTVVGGVVSSMRWGIFKGIQVTEAGVGTQTIPHSMAETEDPKEQAMLAMFSTYCAGFIAFLSGTVALVTNTWQDPGLPLGITMVAKSFEIYFSYFGIALVAISTLLFAFGTILGNSYNGSQCFGFLAGSQNIYFYYAGTAVMIFLGSISGVALVWSLIDLGLACLVLPHIAALVKYAYQQESEVPNFEMAILGKSSD